MPYANPETKRANAREYRRTPEAKALRAKWLAVPENHERVRTWSSRNRDKSRQFTRDWRQANPEKILAAQQKGAADRATAALWVPYTLGRLRRSSRAKGIPFNLELSDLILTETCPVFGTPFVFGGGRHHPQGPSVDKIIPALGYVKGNVIVISLRANVLKRDCVDHRELRLVADYVQRHNP